MEGRKARWPLIAVLAAILGVSAVYLSIWYVGHRDWQKQAAPLFSEIEPADDAVVQGRDAWVRWNAASEATGRVLWREAGGFRIHVVKAEHAQELLAHLGPLKPDRKYEYVVEERADGTTLRSPVRSFAVKAGLAFDTPVEQTVEHDYDQTVKLTLRNTGSETITVAARALKQFDDLPADLTGYGSVDVPAPISPGGTLDLRLAVTAADASHDTYEIPIEAAGAYTVARFHVRTTKLNVSFRVVDENPKTLAKTVEIQNNGDPLTDLAVHAAPENQNDLDLQPAANHVFLGSDATLRVVATPILYLEFQSLKAEIEARSHGGTARFPLEFQAPPGAHLIAVRTASTISSKGGDWYCTNRPNTCSVVPGAHASGPAAPPGQRLPAEVHESSRTQQFSYSEAIANLSHVGVIRSPGPDSVKATRTFGQGSSLVPLAYAADEVGSCKAPVQPDSDCESNNNRTPTPRLCNLPLCSTEELDHCYSTARRLHDDLADWIGGYRYFGNLDKGSSEDREKAFKAYRARALREYRVDPGMTFRSADSWVQDNYSLAAQWVSRLEHLYDDLRWSCLNHCDIIFPRDLTADMPPCGPRTVGGRCLPPDLDPVTAILGRQKYRKKAEELANLSSYDLGRLGLPINLSELPFCQQVQKAFYLEMYESATAEAEESDRLGKALAKLDAYGKRISSIIERTDPGLAGVAADNHAEAKKADAEVFKKALCDPPSPHFADVVVPAIQTVPIPAGATNSERLGWESINASRAEVGYLRAWIDSYERFQGAHAAKNSQGMLRQAVAMLQFATSAQRAGGVEGDKWLDFQTQLWQKLDVSKEGDRLDWIESLANFPLNVKGEDLPLGLRASMNRAGFSKEKIQLFAKQLSNITPAQVRTTLIGWTSYMRRGGNRPQTWPEKEVRSRSSGSADVAPLIEIESLSRKLLQIARREGVGLGDHELLSPKPQLRVGYPEALSHRAVFTRAHRGALAVPGESKAADSGNYAATFYSAGRVYFGWHQQDDVVFIAFDPAGKQVAPPQVIGRGRWPRIAANERRVAVAWSSAGGNNFVVRLNDGKRWSDEIQLNGHEAALAFAPGGFLYAATSSGLWKLNGNAFDRQQEANYSQPAITVDKEGKPHVAWCQNGGVLYDGREVGGG